jgi:hypothetical protein
MRGGRAQAAFGWEDDMAIHGRKASRRLGVAGAALIAAACQQVPAAKDANGADAGQTPGNAAAAAPGEPHPVTMEPDPANQTGPVARSVDADFPEPCQAYVRETQACLDALAGSGAVARTRELRLQLHSNRGTWLRVQDRSGLTNICRDNLGMLRETRTEYRC